MKHVRLALAASLAVVTIAAIGIVSAQDSNTANVEVRVWQSTRDAERLWISARPEGGSWATLGTIPLSMGEVNTRGTLRYEDITLAVPVTGVDAPAEPTPSPTTGVDPRPDNTYTLAELADMPAPAAPQPPPLPDHLLAVDNWSFRGSPFQVHLADASGVVMNLTHNFRSRQYPVVCRSSYGSLLRCEYSETKPLNTSGTARLSLSQAASSVDEYDFVSLSMEGRELQCVERPRTRDRTWWCYDPSTYAAWERARDAALEPATDPLERWLRAEDGPPLWYQDSPYSGRGSHTTGVMRVEPYVAYEVSRTYGGEYLNLFGLCVPIDAITGQPDVHSEGVVQGLVGDGFTLRGTYLCEWAVVTDEEWTLSVSPTE